MPGCPSLDNEFEDMNAYLEDRRSRSWSLPPTRTPTRGSDATSIGHEREFDMMDPLDYLNARDLAAGSTESPSLAAKKQQPIRSTVPVDIIALDILPIEPIPGVHTVQIDFSAPNAADKVIELLANLSTRRVGKEETRYFQSAD